MHILILLLKNNSSKNRKKILDQKAPFKKTVFNFFEVWTGAGMGLGSFEGLSLKFNYLSQHTQTGLKLA